MEEIVIDENNFAEYFRDTRHNKPQHGDVMVFYKSMAELVGGDLKHQMIEALFHESIGAQKAIQLFMKLGGASHKAAVLLVKEMNDDLISGMSKEDVFKKSYKFFLEMSFYTKKEYVPKDDPHWELVNLKNFAGKDSE
jgi:hypothetical protein